MVYSGVQTYASYCQHLPSPSCILGRSSGRWSTVQWVLHCTRCTHCNRTRTRNCSILAATVMYFHLDDAANDQKNANPTQRPKNDREHRYVRSVVTVAIVAVCRLAATRIITAITGTVGIVTVSMVKIVAGTVAVAAATTEATIIFAYSI